MSDYSTYVGAKRLIIHELYELSLNVPENERDSFFDPRNRDLWMDSFINQLKAKYQQPDRIASND